MSVFLFAKVLMFCGLPALVQSPTSVAEDVATVLPTVDFKAVPLNQALAQLIRDYQLPLVYRPQDVAGLRVTFSCQSCPVVQILNGLVLDRRLQWRQVADQWILGRAAPASLSGKVVLQFDGLPLDSADILLTGADTRRSIRTGSDGRFSFEKLEPGVYQMQVSVSSFEPVTRKISLDAGAQQEVIVTISDLLTSLEHLVVMPSYYAMMAAAPNLGQALSRQEIQRMPHLADDIYHAADRLPGLSAGDFGGLYFVRGGNRDELLVRLDGAEIENPFHLRPMFSGIVSMIDAETIDNAELMTAGFPIKFGSKMAGVLDIETHNPKEQKTSLGINFLNARIQTQGPLKQGGYLVNVRRGFLDIALEFISDEPLETSDVNYDDLYVKAFWEFAQGHRLSTSLLTARDDAETVERGPLVEQGLAHRTQTSSDTQFLWLSWSAPWSDRLSSQTTLLFGQSTSKSDGKDQLGTFHFNVRDLRDMQRVHLSSDWHLNLSNHFVQAGLVFESGEAQFDYANQREYLNAGTVLASSETAVVRNATGREYGFYLADRFRLNHATAMEVGLRFDHQTLTAEQQLSYRLNLMRDLGKMGHLKLGWGRFNQPQSLQELQVEDGESDYFSAQRAIHTVFGWHLDAAPGTTLRVEGYLKRYADLRPRYENHLNPLWTFPEVQFDRIRVDATRAKASGLEFSLQHRREPFTTMFSYALAEAVDQLEDGSERPRFWEQPETFNLSFFTQLSPRWALGAAWRYHDGWRQTPFEVAQTDDGHIRVVEGPLYSSQMPPYHRLDLRLAGNWSIDRRKHIHFFIEIINLYNRDNIRGVEDIFLILNQGDRPRIGADTETWLPFLPSIGFKFTF